MPLLSFVYPTTTGSTATTFLTMAQLYALLADQLGSYLRSATSSTIPSGEPGRWLLVDDLKDDEKSRAAFAGGYAYIPNGAAGTQRALRTEGYEGPFGAVALTRVLETSGIPANLAAQTVVEFTEPLPVRRIGTTKGLFECLVEGARAAWTTARIPLVGNGTRIYGLDGYSFITGVDDTDGVYSWQADDGCYVPTTGPSRLSHSGYDINVNGATITLETHHTYTQDTPFELKVFVRAANLVFDGSVWAYTSTGPANETDQMAISPRWAVAFGMVKALQYVVRAIGTDKTLSQEEKAARLAPYADPLRYWNGVAGKIIRNELPQADPKRRESSFIPSLAVQRF